MTCDFSEHFSERFDEWVQNSQNRSTPPVIRCNCIPQVWAPLMSKAKAAGEAKTRGVRLVFLRDELIKRGWSSESHAILQCASDLPATSQVSLCGGNPSTKRSELPPVFYDEALLEATNDGRLSIFKASLDRPCFGGCGVHAQSRTGVMILMRVCRNIGIKERDAGTANLEELLKRDVNLLVCCDAGRNCLHDLFWGSSSLASINSPEALHMLEAFKLILGARGIRTAFVLLQVPPPPRMAAAAGLMPTIARASCCAGLRSTTTTLRQWTTSPS